MSIFARIDEASTIAKQAVLLSATDGIHGTDGESNRHVDRAGNTDGVHGTDGEDFGSDESIPMEHYISKKPRRNYPHNASHQTHALLEARRRMFDGSPGNLSDLNEAEVDLVANDDEEYLTNGLRGTEDASEADAAKHELFGPLKKDTRMSSGIAAFFSALFPRKKSVVHIAARSGGPNFARSSDEAINEALERWKEAERYFQMLPHNDLVDYAAYNLEAARRRYVFLLNMERKQTKLSQELGLSESFEAGRAAPRPMRDHMIRIPEDTLPQ